MKQRFPWPAAAALVALAALAGCGALDVVGRTAVGTFGAVLDRERDRVTLDAASGHWVLTSPGGERFSWSTDFSATGPDFRISLDATPFLAAGLDPSRLPAERYAFDAASRALTLSFELSSAKLPASSVPDARETFRHVVERNRAAVGYHEALDHYGIALGDGNMLEWAKTLATNDKDLVFVLNPQPLIAAGVDPAKVAGWAFAKVAVKDGSGRTIEVDKFLKPYDLGG